jgi:hypothetical protein
LPCQNAKSTRAIPGLKPGITPGVYRPRQPLESDFHRLVREHFDTFRAAYAQRYARKFGHWRPDYDKAVRQILEQCGLTSASSVEPWQDPPPPTANPPPRSPPHPRRRSRRSGATAPKCPMPEADAGVSYEVDPEYLEHAHREALDNQDQPELPWDA